MHLADYADMACMSVVYGVGGKFAHDAQDGVCRHIRYSLARRGEFNGHFHLSGDRFDRFPNGLREIRFVEGVAPEVPKASAQFGAA